MMFRIVRRRKEAVTNYKRRIAMLKGGIDRVVIRKSNRNIIAQAVRFDQKGDKILTSATSKELKAFGWEPRANIPTAYLTGVLLAQKSKSLNIDKYILDIGLYKPIKSSVIFSATKGCIDNGMNIIGNFEVSSERISGEHIINYAKQNVNGIQFSKYRKEGFDISNINRKLEEVKKKIEGK